MDLDKILDFELLDLKFNYSYWYLNKYDMNKSISPLIYLI